MSLDNTSKPGRPGPDELVPSRYALRVGEIDVLVISDGVFPLAAATLATNADPADLAAWLDDRLAPKDVYKWPLNVVVVCSGGRTVLIDSGAGSEFPAFPGVGQLATRLDAAGIIDRVRSLYGRGTPEREVVDLNEILREMTALLEDTADRHSISIRAELDLGLPRTTADRVQLQQVLMNLMLNGIEAMRETGGELTIASKRIEHGQLLISVRDWGIGLPVDEAQRVFDAFFTTKPQGTGMGLSISRRIIESHDGRLWASPNARRGAIFQFTLPGT